MLGAGYTWRHLNVLKIGLCGWCTMSSSLAWFWSQQRVVHHALTLPFVGIKLCWAARTHTPHTHYFSYYFSHKTHNKHNCIKKGERIISCLKTQTRVCTPTVGRRRPQQRNSSSGRRESSIQGHRQTRTSTSTHHGSRFHTIALILFLCFPLAIVSHPLPSTPLPRILTSPSFSTFCFDTSIYSFSLFSASSITTNCTFPFRIAPAARNESGTRQHAQWSECHKPTASAAGTGVSCSTWWSARYKASHRPWLTRRWIPYNQGTAIIVWTKQRLSRFDFGWNGTWKSGRQVRIIIKSCGLSDLTCILNGCWYVE